VFGTPEAERDALADHLGKALQLTNILRDIDEDAEIGRLYLPRETLEAAGIGSRDPLQVAADPRLAEACAPIIARAREHFVRAKDIMDRCPRATVRAPRVMYEAYKEILAGVSVRGFAPPRHRVKVSKGRFVLSLLRHGLM
jgi:presqualene diphosphate synthase